VCPLFLPGSTIPLTGLFTGACAADRSTELSGDTLRECCNRGHAREACERAAKIEADAVCLLVKSDRKGIVEVAWAIERNHHPVQVGTEQVNGKLSSTETLAVQAFAVAEQYRNQKGAS
jgi:hypothetical protein